MSSLMRRVGIGALLLLGFLAGQETAQAQFSFGYTRYGFNPGNPFVAQQQYLQNLQAGRLAIATGQQVPAWLPYVAPYASPFGGAYNAPYAASSYAAPIGTGYNPYIGGFGGGYGGGYGYGANPYLAGGVGGVGSNPYSPTGGYDPSLSSPNSSLAASYALSNPYANPAVGPGLTLMGGADIMRAYGTVITSQEQARLLRQKYYQEKLETAKKKFDLDMYFKANTPTYADEQIRITKQILKRVQNSSNPAEIADGRALNILLDDMTKYPNKAPVSEFPLDDSVPQQINVKPAGLGQYSLGLLRTGGKLNWPTALVELLTPAARNEIATRAQALAQSALAGKEPDRLALKDLRLQIKEASDRLEKKVNEFGTSEFMQAQRYLEDLERARKAIDIGSAAAQVQFQQMVAKGEIRTLNDLVSAMVRKGWRFAPASPADEGAYRALHSALVSYDVALNQLVAQSEP